MRTPAEVDAFREQKVLLSARDKGTRRALAERYLATATSVLPANEHRTLTNYVEYVLLAGEHFAQLAQFATTERNKLTRLSRSTLMSVCAETSNTMASSYLDAAWTNYPSEASPQTQASATATRLHEANAKLLDLAFAVTRAVTFISPCVSTRRAGRPQTVDKRERAAINRLITIASNWNTFEYVLDQVTFGEWSVTAFQRSPTEIRLEPSNRVLWKAKRHAIRHRLVHHNLIRKRRSWLENILEDVLIGGIAYAAEYFRSREHSKHLSTSDVESAVRKRINLAAFDVEDELLFVADPDRQQIAAHYAVAVLLRCFEEAGNALNERIPRGEVVRYAWFERAVVEYVLSELNLPGDVLTAALNAQVGPIPRRHWDLLQHPFVLVSDDVIGVLGFGGHWPSSLRLLADRRGPLADRYGRLWEGFVEFSLTRYGWIVLGRSIPLKEGGRDITDIDLLMINGDALYVLQVKGISSSGLNPFEQWKARLTIEDGVIQASKAVAWLQRHPGVLRALKGICYREVQPIVITNAELFNGWNIDGIPIIALSELTSWLRGASIRYQNTKGETAEVHHYIAGTEPTDSEVRALLANPLTWRGDPLDEVPPPLIACVRSVTFHIPP